MGRGSACSEAGGGGGVEVAPPSAFCPPHGGPQPPATTRPSAACRRTLSAGSVWETPSVARAGPAQTFCECNLDIPGEVGGAGLQGRRGREARAKAAASSGADSRWAEGLKGSQSGSRGCCQSRGSLQSHPCHFQNLGPTVQLKCGVRSANRGRTEWGRERAELGDQDKEVKEPLIYTCFWRRAEGGKSHPREGL